MEERTKIAYGLDESEYKSWKSCVYLGERVKIISAYKTKNASSKFFANRNNSSKMRGVPQQSVRSTSSTLALFSAASLQVALFIILAGLVISSVGCLYIVWNKAICNAYM